MGDARKIKELALPRRLLRRLLDVDANLDYLWLFLLGAWPILLAWLIGAHDDRNGFEGYYGKFNWYSMAAILPLTLWLFRLGMDRIAPVLAAEASDDLDSLPPVVQLVDTPQGRAAVYESLRGTLLAGGNLVFVLLLVALFHVADMWEVGSVYLSGSAEKATELDWSIMFAGTPIPAWQNLLLVISAYALQFMLLVILFLFVVLIARHNRFFLDRIYQRRRVAEEETDRYITIDLDDIDMCFGFKRANRAFNVQVQFLAGSGFLLLLSRYANLLSAGDGGGASLLPDVGQVAIVLGWFAGLLIVTMPMVVKVLPWFGSKSSRSLVNYLQEFLPDSRWPYGDSPNPKVVETLAARFAANAFWPTGNNQAKFLFLLSFVAMCLLLSPDPGVAAAELPLPGLLQQPGWLRWSGAALYIAVAVLLTGLLLLLFRLALIWVDPRLVKAPDGPIMTTRELNESLGVESGKASHRLFISYRRQDSAAYAGRLKETLEQHFYPDNIFFDLEGIAAGADFVHVIEDQIAASDVMLVVIGPQWLSAADAEGRPRLGRQDDYVTVEIATALRRRLEIIPILVGGADFPKREELPESIAAFARKNAAEISDSRWKSDVQRIVDAMLAMVPGKGPQTLS